MEQNNKCPECGELLSEERFGCAVTYKCSKCGWSVATTEFEKIDLDRTEYRVVLKKGGVASKENLAFVSKITGQNFLVCKQTIEQGGLVFSGNAREVLTMRTELDSFSMQYSIDPKFPY